MYSKREKKMIRRQITKDFSDLDKNSNTILIAEFIAIHKDNITLMREALSKYKNLTVDPRARLVWEYLEGKSTSEFALLVNKSEYIQEARAEINIKIPPEIKFEIDCVNQVPDYDQINERKLGQFIRQYIGDNARFNLDIMGSFFLPGTYEFRIIFENLTYIDKTITIDLIREELRKEDADHLAQVETVPLDDSVNDIDELENYLKGYSASNIPGQVLDPRKRYNALTRLMRTIYETGFWSTDWAVELYTKWQDSYAIYLEIARYETVLDEIEEWVQNQGIIMLPESCNEQEEIEAFVLNLLNEHYEIPLDTFKLRLESSVNSSTLRVSLSIYGIIRVYIYLLNFVQFLPNDVLEIIRSYSTASLARLNSTRDSGEFLKLCDKETQRGTNLDDYGDRADTFGAICHVMLSRLSDETIHIQFKRTLTAYYAAYASQLFELQREPENQKARRFFLLYFNMLYREDMLSYMKSFNKFEVVILSVLMATYLTNNEMRRGRAYYAIKNRPGVYDDDQKIDEYQLFWGRCAQLWVTDSQTFFASWLDIFIINKNLADELMNMLRNKIARIGRFRTDALNATNSIEFRQKLVQFLLQASTRKDNKLLFDFAHYMLDSKVVMNEQHLAEAVFEQARLYRSAESFVERSQIYNSIEMQSNTAMSALDSLAFRVRQRGHHAPQREAKLDGIRNLKHFINIVKNQIYKEHQKLFHSTELSIQVDEGQIPYNMETPVEVCIINEGVGRANNIRLILNQNDSYELLNNDITIDSIAGKLEQYLQIYIIVRGGEIIEFNGYIEYSDNEMSNKRVDFSFRLPILDIDTYPKFSSPYIPGDPIRDSQMFYGRRKELDDILSTIRGKFQDRSIVLHGRRRIGKTSLLQQIIKGDAEYLNIPQLSMIQQEYIFVYIDFEHLSDEYLAYHLIYSKINFELMMDGFEGMDISANEFREQNPGVMLDQFIMRAIMYLMKSNRKLLIMCDEFDHLIHIVDQSPSNSAQIFGYIRKLIMEYGRQLLFMFVGAEHLISMMTQHAQRLYQISGEPIEVQPLSFQESVELIVEPMRLVCRDYEWSQDAIDYLYYLTQGNPYYIQSICGQVVNELQRNTRLKATWSDINNAVHKSEMITAELEELMEQVNSLEKVVMSCMAEMIKGGYRERRWTNSTDISSFIGQISDKFPTKTVPELLKSLRNRYILVEEAGVQETKYSIKVPLLQIYIAKNWRVRDILLAEGY